jgi:hypothetical protein
VELWSFFPPFSPCGKSSLYERERWGARPTVCETPENSYYTIGYLRRINQTINKALLHKVEMVMLIFL